MFKYYTILTALMRALAVSIVERRLSPIFTETTWAPGATPLVSGLSGKYPAAMQATCVPWEPGWMEAAYRHYMIKESREVCV